MQSAENYLPFLAELADAAAEAVLKHFRVPIEVRHKETTEKAGFDPVTEADREAETAMRRLIRARFPEHGILGEEFGSEGEGRSHQWVIDPIDGTKAFICGLPLWGSLAGLTVEGRPVCGMLSQPYLGERFFGTPQAAFLERGGRRERLKARPCPALDAAMLAATSPDMFSPAEGEAFRRLGSKVRLTRFGYDCYAYGMLAMGFVDIIAEAGMNAYDIVPLIPIVEGAGGLVCGWDGSEPALGGRILALGDRRLKEAAVACLQV
ncbi:histidinol-phosphatase [Afifella pfennigii]|uniref:histidinol-phosphatase n=1 Tax=Afifella pfennigii TaxID=209897 RepID=UPI00047C506E|nr:histidinol-phosphatase [Afifella pfennigii]